MPGPGERRTGPVNRRTTTLAPKVFDVDVRLDLRELVPPDGRIVYDLPPLTEAIVTFDVGHQKAWYDYNCAGYGTTWTPHLQYVWSALHADDLAPGSPIAGSQAGTYGLRLQFTSATHATATSGDALLDDHGNHFSEATLMSLDHRPQP